MWSSFFYSGEARVYIVFLFVVFLLTALIFTLEFLLHRI